MNWVGLSYKNIYRNKRRSILTMLSVGAVAFVMMFQHSVVRGMQSDLIKNIKELRTGDLFVENRDLEKYQMFNPLSLLVSPEEVRQITSKYPTVSMVESMDFSTSLYQDDTMIFTKGMAFSMKDQSNIGKQGSIFKIYKDEGHLPQGDSEVAVALHLAEKNHIKVGDRVSILTQTVSHNLNGASFTVSAIMYFSVENFNGDTFLFDIPGAQKLLKTDQVSRILINTGGNEPLSKELVNVLNDKLKNTEYTAKYWEETSEASILKVQDKILLIINTIFFVIGASIIVNTSIMNILERRREIGMMGALGTHVREIRLLFFLESVWLGTLGTLLGILFASIIGIILNYTGWDLLGQAVSQETGLAISSTLYPQVLWRDILEVFLFGFIISSVISYIPTGRIAKVTPAEAFRS